MGEAAHAQGEDLRRPNLAQLSAWGWRWGAVRCGAVRCGGAWRMARACRHPEGRPQRQQRVRAHGYHPSVAGERRAEPAEEAGDGAEEERRAQVECVDERPDQEADDGAEQAVEGVEDAGLDVGEAELVGEEGRVHVREGIVGRALGKLDREDDEEVSRRIAELCEAGLEALGLEWHRRSVDARIAAPAIAAPAHPTRARTCLVTGSVTRFGVDSA